MYIMADQSMVDKPMLHSDLILGLSSEERESALRQVLLWDGMTVGAGLQRALVRHLPELRRHVEGDSWQQALQGNFQKAHEELRRQLQEALEKLQDHLQNAPEKEPAWIHEFTNPLDPQAMKLCRLLDHYGMSITAVPDIGTLHVDGRTIEKRAIEDVRRAQRQRGSAGSPTPVVETIHNLARYALCQLFTFLDDWLSKASTEERERVAEQIAEALNGLGADVQEEVRRVTGLDPRTIETLVRTGKLAALAAAVAAAAGISGFAVYAMLSATIAGAAGIIGLTLPFSVYVMATSLLACLVNPVVLSVATVGGGVFWVRSANRRMRAELVPLLVAFAAMKSADPEARGRSRALVAHLANRYREFLDGGRVRRAQLRQAFPAFPATLGERACELIIRAPSTPGVSAAFPSMKR
jgi:nucleotide-binding universal stress UspA family protein